MAPRTFWCRPLALAALVNVGISLDASRQAAATALYDAIKKKDLMAVIAALRENRSDVNARDDAGAPPLHVAAQLDQGGIVDALLGVGADPRAPATSPFNGCRPTSAS